MVLFGATGTTSLKKSLRNISRVNRNPTNLFFEKDSEIQSLLFNPLGRRELEFFLDLSSDFFGFFLLLSLKRNVHLEVDGSNKNVNGKIDFDPEIPFWTETHSELVRKLGYRWWYQHDSSRIYYYIDLDVVIIKIKDSS